MLKQNSELRAEARAALTDKWVMAAIATLIYSAVVGGLSAIPVVGILILLLTLPIAYGYAIVILDVFRGSDVDSATMDVSSAQNCFKPFIQCCGPCCWLFRVLSSIIRMQ